MENNVLPESLHFVGVGGIGMSGLAQMARALGHTVTGSDRALNSPENAVMFRALQAQGITLFPQDGSRFEKIEKPDALVYSTAIEEGNPDFEAAATLPRLHRSQALAAGVAELHSQHTIAVTGTCGKTTVSSWLAESLYVLGQDPGVLTGGLINGLRAPDAAGNFRKGSGKYFVLEADESDKSLLNYTADSAVILNIGTDHYSKEELARVFGTFLSKIRTFAVVELDAMQSIEEHFGKLPETLKVVLFSCMDDAPAQWRGYPVFRLKSFSSGPEGAFAEFEGAPCRIHLPGPGRHQAANALALYAELLTLGFAPEEALSALEKFHGTWRRFDPAGTNRKGVRFFDDYAHNVEKIMSCIEAGRELASGRLIIFFQPHGYGPFGFMREELFQMLEKNLRDDDVFSLLPVYYAGGTSSFKPQASDVAAEYKKNGARHYEYMADRAAALRFVRENANAGDIVLVMGARDNSLSDWSKELAVQSDL